MTDFNLEFYDERLLPVPDREYRPESAGQLREVVEGAGGDESDQSLLVLGGGEHLRSAAVGERRFDVVRTDACDGVLAFDQRSDTIQVEAGVTWRQLHEALADERRSLHRYGLHPAGASIGGLLARWQPLEGQLHRGDLRAGCIALRTASPGGAGYSYLPAPRKASGPDHRFLYIGGEGALGVVLEAKLVVAREHPGVLLEWEAPEVSVAVERFRTLDRLDVRTSWCRWSASEESFETTVYGPAELLDEWVRRIRNEAQEGLSVSRGDAAEERRRELEENHPGARSTKGAEDRHRVVWPLSELSEAVGAVGEALDDLVVLDWGPQRAVAYLHGGEGDETGIEALSRRAIVDEGEGIWPAWAQKLKAQLDPERRLAVGP